MKFQAISPTLLWSNILFTLLCLIFLFLIYLVIWCNNSLMFLKPERRYSSIPCKEIGWKLPFQESCSIVWLILYSNWILKLFYGKYILLLLLVVTSSSCELGRLLKANISLYIHYTLFWELLSFVCLTVLSFCLLSEA